METGAVSRSTGRRWSPPIIDGPDSIARIEAQPYHRCVPFTSTIDLILHNARCFPAHPAVLFQVEPHLESAPLALSYDQVADQILRAGTLLRRAGVSRADPVALIAPNIPSAHVALWGAQLAGHVFPINYLLGPEHIAGLLKTSNAKVVITLGECKQLPIWPTALEAVNLAGGDIRVFKIDPSEEAPSADSFQSLLSRVPPGHALVDEITPDTTAAIFHTGGTTGMPKILRHTHANELHTSCMAAAYYQFVHGDRMLNGFPLFHVAGVFVYGLAVLAAGGTVYIPTLLGMRNQAFVANAWKFFEANQITHLGCVPTTLASLAQSHTLAGLAGGFGVQVALTGGSALPAEIASHFETRTGVPVRNIFGMTECAVTVAIEPAVLEDPSGSVALAPLSTQVR